MAFITANRNYIASSVPTPNEANLAQGAIESSPSLAGDLAAGDAVFRDTDGTWKRATRAYATAIYDGTYIVRGQEIVVLSGLTPGATYYVHPEISSPTVNISTAPSAFEAGIALDSTHLLATLHDSGMTGYRQITATTHTLELADANYLFGCTNAATQTITVPPNADVAFPIGTWIAFEQLGADVIEIAEGSGVTIVVIQSAVEAQLLTKVAENTWHLIGTKT